MFERLASRGVLELEDPRLAAAHFNWLVMSIPLNEAMLLGEDEPRDPRPAPALRRRRRARIPRGVPQALTAWPPCPTACDRRGGGISGNAPAEEVHFARAAASQHPPVSRQARASTTPLLSNHRAVRPRLTAGGG